MEKRSKRGHGEGSIRQTKSGKFEAATWINAIGKRISVTAETEAKARKMLRERVAMIKNGQATARQANIAFYEYAQQVIREREGIGQRTRDKYIYELEHYLNPLHEVKIDKITPEMLRSLYAGLRQRQLSTTVRGHAHTLVRLVLEVARTDGKIAINPADKPGLRPKPERGEDEAPKAFTAEQAAQLTRMSHRVLHGAVLRFLLSTGMRRGEALGLQRDSLDLQAGKATVRTTRSVSGARVYESTPKTTMSRRVVPLSTSTVSMLRELNALNDERHQALYPERPAPRHVFMSLKGTPLRPDNLWQILRQVYALIDEENEQLARRKAKEMGTEYQPPAPFPRLPVHGLRHTFVSLMAAQGVRLEVIARWIGDDPTTVMKVYLHVFNADTAMPELQLPVSASDRQATQEVPEAPSEMPELLGETETQEKE